MKFSFLYVTTKDRQESLAIGRALVEARLAACANIFDMMESIYWWGDELINTGESVLILKTRANLVDECTARIKALHSYNLPNIVALPIEGGNDTFLRWVADETGDPLYALDAPQNNQA